VYHFRTDQNFPYFPFNITETSSNKQYTIQLNLLILLLLVLHNQPTVTVETSYMRFLEVS